MGNKEWLKNLKVGDEVIKTGTYDKLVKVERFTATQIVVATNRKYRKSDGKEVGFGGFHTSILVEPTEERRNTIIHRRHVNYFKEFDWASLSLDTLRQIYKMTQV